MPIPKTHVRPGLFALLAIVSLFATGCSRAVVSTTVKPNGAFTRTIVFHGPKPDANGGGGGGLAGPGLSGSLEDAFELPAGAAWKTKREKMESEEVYTAERALTPGSVQKQDIAIKSGDKAKPGITVLNEATVRNVGPGKWEYRETLRWNGPKPDMMAAMDPTTLQKIKACLPPALATDSNTRPIILALAQETGHALFGPGDPLISSWSQFMMQPENVTRKLLSRMSPGVDKALTAQLGAKLTPTERRVCVHKIIGVIADGISDKTAAGADPAKANAKPDFGGALTALTFSVKLPGKIVSTNGERDDYSGEVYWSVYPQAASLGDVEMIAVCDTNAQ